MAVEEVFDLTIGGRRVLIVHGPVTEGEVRVSDQLVLVGHRGARSVTCSGIEFHVLRNRPGNWVGLRLEGVSEAEAKDAIELRRD